MSALRRVAAALVLALLTWQSSGLAIAFERDATVHCCCGEHASGQPCDCPDCPGVGALRFLPSRKPAPPPASHATLRPCAGRSQPAALFHAPTVFRAGAAAALVTPASQAAPALPDPEPLRDRLIEAVRPPP